LNLLDSGFRQNDGKTGKMTFYWTIKIDGFVKSPIIVMPDLIRHPEPVEFTGFRLPPE